VCVGRKQERADAAPEDGLSAHHRREGACTPGGKASERRELPPIAARVPGATGACAALFSGEGSGEKSGLTVSTRSERDLTQTAR
jgi:hypothetical protein